MQKLSKWSTTRRRISLSIKEAMTSTFGCIVFLLGGQWDWPCFLGWLGVFSVLNEEGTDILVQNDIDHSSDDQLRTQTHIRNPTTKLSTNGRTHSARITLSYYVPLSFRRWESKSQVGGVFEFEEACQGQNKCWIGEGRRQSECMECGEESIIVVLDTVVGRLLFHLFMGTYVIVRC